MSNNLTSLTHDTASDLPTSASTIQESQTHASIRPTFAKSTSSSSELMSQSTTQPHHAGEMTVGEQGQLQKKDLQETEGSIARITSGIGGVRSAFRLPSTLLLSPGRWADRKVALPHRFSSTPRSPPSRKCRPASRRVSSRLLPPSPRASRTSPLPPRTLRPSTTSLRSRSHRLFRRSRSRFRCVLRARRKRTCADLPNPLSSILSSPSQRDTSATASLASLRRASKTRRSSPPRQSPRPCPRIQPAALRKFRSSRPSRIRRPLALRASAL